MFKVACTCIAHEVTTVPYLQAGCVEYSQRISIKLRSYHLHACTLKYFAYNKIIMQTLLLLLGTIYQHSLNVSPQLLNNIHIIYRTLNELEFQLTVYVCSRKVAKYMQMLKLNNLDDFNNLIGNDSKYYLHHSIGKSMIDIWKIVINNVTSAHYSRTIHCPQLPEPSENYFLSIKSIVATSIEDNHQHIDRMPQLMGGPAAGAHA